jgi:sarcosine oxidase
VSHELIVVGAGGAVGSAALLSAARRGRRVLGLDRFDPGHARGSSHGQTRVIRQAYHEHPDYVPILRRAYALWDQLAAETGQELFVRCGVLEIGPPDGEVVPGALQAAAQHGLSVEHLAPSELAPRVAGLEIPAGMEGVFERNAGYLHVEQCIKAQVAQARAAGAEYGACAVDGWVEKKAGGFVVFADGREHHTQRLVVAPGAWAPELLGSLVPPLDVRRKVQIWYGADARYDRDAGFPVFSFEFADGRHLYGLPSIDARGVKIADHVGGLAVQDPLDLDRTLHAHDTDPIEDFLRWLPGVDREDRRHHAVCMYTCTSDGHFIIDRQDALAFACGLSGHGFKMSAALGEIVVDLVLDGDSDKPWQFLSRRRFK